MHGNRAPPRWAERDGIWSTYHIYLSGHPACAWREKAAGLSVAGGLAAVGTPRDIYLQDGLAESANRVTTYKGEADYICFHACLLLACDAVIRLVRIASARFRPSVRPSVLCKPVSLSFRRSVALSP